MVKNKILTFVTISILLSSALFSINTVSAANSGSGDSEQCYGFILPVSDDQSVDIQNSICKLVNELLGKNVDVYWIASDLSVSSKGLNENDVVETITFDKGSFIIPFSGNPSTDLEITVTMYHYRYNIISSVAIYKVMDSLSNIIVYKLVEPKIAYHDGEGVDSWEYSNCLRNGGFPDGEFLDWDEITPTRLNEFNVFIWGGTYGDHNFNEINKWNSAVDSVKNFIENGGGYVGSCLGGYVVSSGIGIPEDLPDLGLDLPILDYFIGIDCLTLPALPGHGTVNIEITDPDNPVAFGVKEFTKQGLYGGPVFTGLGPNTKPLAVYDSVVEGSFNWWDGDEYDYCEIPESLRELWAGYTLGRASAVTSQLGDGKVIAFGTHPEYSDENSRFVHNAVFYVTSQGPTSINIQRSISFQNMDLDAGGPYERSVSEPISFNGRVSSEYQPSCWFWDFGDGETSTNQNPTHAYSSPQEYTVLLFAADNNNINVDVTTVNVQGGDLNVYIPGGYYNTKIQDSAYYYAEVSGGFPPYSYHWNMGDGITFDEESFSYSHEEVGIYDASVTVTDMFGTFDTCYFKIIVNDMSAPFEMSYLIEDPYCTAIGVYIKFEASISVKDDSRHPCAYHCKFDFDDGSFDESSFELPKGTMNEGLECFHSYSNLGTFYPILTVTDDYGSMYFAITGVNIDNLGSPVKPAKPFGPTSLKTGYDNGGEYSVTTTDPDGDHIEYRWDKGNGRYYSDYWYESGEACTRYLYWDEEGEYNLRVRAVDDHGHRSGWSDPLTVIVTEDENTENDDDNNEHEPLAKLTTSSDIITRGNTIITFDASGSTPEGIAPITWIRWDFDDDEEWDTSWRLFVFNKKKTKNFNYLFNEDNTGITEFDVKIEIKDILQRTNNATKKIIVDYSNGESQPAGTTGTSTGLESNQPEDENYCNGFPNGPCALPSFGMLKTDGSSTTYANISQIDELQDFVIKVRMPCACSDNDEPEGISTSEPTISQPTTAQNAQVTSSALATETSQENSNTQSTSSCPCSRDAEIENTQVSTTTQSTDNTMISTAENTQTTQTQVTTIPAATKTLTPLKSNADDVESSGVGTLLANNLCTPIDYVIDGGLLGIAGGQIGGCEIKYHTLTIDPDDFEQGCNSIDITIIISLSDRVTFEDSSDGDDNSDAESIHQILTIEFYVGNDQSSGISGESSSSNQVNASSNEMNL